MAANESYSHLFPGETVKQVPQCEHFSGTFMWRSHGELILGWTVIVGRLEKSQLKKIITPRLKPSVFLLV